jgi:hypothetical protein
MKELYWIECISDVLFMPVCHLIYDWTISWIIIFYFKCYFINLILRRSVLMYSNHVIHKKCIDECVAISMSEQ